MVTRLGLVARRQLLPCPNTRHLLLPLLDLRDIALAVGSKEGSVKSARWSSGHAAEFRSILGSGEGRLTLRSMPSSRSRPKPVLRERDRRGLRGEEAEG